MIIVGKPKYYQLTTILVHNICVISSEVIDYIKQSK